MAYDEDLAERVRQVLATETDVDEKRMFGGLAFLLGGRMSVAVSGNGGLMVRTIAGQTEKLLAEPGVVVVEMRGRRMNNWLRVEPAQLSTEAALRTWVDRGVEAARAQPRPA